MRSLLLIPVLTLLAACPATPEAETGPPADALPRRLGQALTLPPSSATGPAMDELKKMAGGGSCAAAWTRARYLLDLYDAVRLQPMMSHLDHEAFAQAHLQLWIGLNIPGSAGRGELATRQVQAALEQQFKAVPASCPQTAQARAALDLMAADNLPRKDVPEALASAVAVKRIARASSEVAPNATLRLCHWCISAFRLAAGGEPALQHLRLNQCLFPLYTADPSPYFEKDPTKRPPDPPWTLLGKGLSKLARTLSGGRLAGLAAPLQRAADYALSDASSSLPVPLDLAILNLPTAPATGAAPWDRLPLVLYTGKGYLVGGRAIIAESEDEAADLETGIKYRLRGDRRGRVTLAAAGSSPARVALTVGRAARLAGARTLELGVVRQVAPATSEGDVQRDVFGQGPVLRLHGVPISLIPLAAKRVPTVARDRPRGLDYDPRSAPNHLMLTLQRGRATLSSRDGVLQPVKFEQIRSTLEAARQAYPDDQGLLILPAPGVTLDELLFAAGAASRTAGDQPLFAGLALAPAGSMPGSAADLSSVMRTLAPARAIVTPAGSRALGRGLLRCYHQALRAAMAEADMPTPSGELIFKRRRGKFKASRKGLKDKDLRKCAAAAMAAEPPSGDGPWTINFLGRSAR